MRMKTRILLLLCAVFGAALFQLWTTSKHRSGRTRCLTQSRKAARKVSLSSITEDAIVPNMTLYADIESIKQKYARHQKCAPIIANPLAYWRSQPQKSNFTAEIDYERITLAVLCGGLLMSEYLETPPHPQLYDFEVPYLLDPPFRRRMTLSNETMSTVRLLNQSDHFQVGDTIALEITVRDGFGRIKAKGGDELRVWFVDRTNKHNKMAARITDHQNGTYVATTILPFSGKLRAFVTLVYPREYFRTLMHTHLMIKSLAFYAGAFVNTQANETTFCYHAPVIPGFQTSEICNLTAANGSPWFCGRPIKRLLTCGDYNYTRLVYNDILLPVTKAEHWLLHRPKTFRYIRGVYAIVVTPGKLGDEIIDRILPITPCNKVPARHTWEQSEPTGYFYQNRWQPYLCQLPQHIDSQCFTNKTIAFLGDSNARRLYRNLAAKTECKHLKAAQHENWHQSLLCVHKENKFTLRWEPHTNPFQSTVTEWASLDWNKASSTAMDEMTNDDHYLIHLNHYLHLTTFHISAYVQKLTTIKHSLQKLLNRNPNVQAVLQGPHILWDFRSTRPYAVSDSMSRFMIAIQREIFKDLTDRVVYIPTYDMTTAAKNTQKHPQVAEDILNVLLGFTCGRK